MSSQITKKGISFEKILYTVANLRSDTNTTNNANEFFFQGILSLSYYTIKYTFFQLWGGISDFTDLKKCMAVKEITQS